MKYCVLLFALWALVASSGALASSPWQLVKRNETLDLKVFTRDMPHSDFKAFKGVIYIDASLDSLVALLQDVENFPDWMYHVTRAKVLNEETKRKTILYIVKDVTWPVTNRDVVFSAVRSQNPDTKVVRFKLSKTANYLGPQPDLVRVEEYSGRWVLIPKPSGLVKVIYQAHVDPGGAIPSWLANSLVVDTPYKTLKNMLAEVRHYQEAKLPYIEGLSN